MIYRIYRGILSWTIGMIGICCIKTLQERYDELVYHKELMNYQETWSVF